ncbi:wu:fc46h12 precursor [Scophthalmus maximus]|uniref:Wu:fc46h12 n=1 Tax=Scophthalmus maximus TaxID=52904 RepID=A0A2U9BIS0_SCOMX|nr:wu:fc46h12 precursor [Scophthalmus maximus]
MTTKTLLLASALFAGLFDSLAAVPITPAPYHAYCRTLWLFATPCADIGSTIVQQIQAFNPLVGCDVCQYKLVSVSPISIKANHTSIDGLQTESISFSFTPTVMTSGCRVTAQSSSLGFTSLLDDGLNYCNLYNLLSASRLTSAPGFMEMTNEWACLGYGLATCKA